MEATLVQQAPGVERETPMEAAVEAIVEARGGREALRHGRRSRCTRCVASASRWRAGRWWRSWARAARARRRC